MPFKLIIDLPDAENERIAQDRLLDLLIHSPEHGGPEVNILASGPVRFPELVPLEVTLRVRDHYSREKFYTHTWEAVETRDPTGNAGQCGLSLTTGMTGFDDQGCRAECTVRVGI